MPEGQLQHPSPDPPARPKPLPGARAWAVLRTLYHRGWLRPRRIGCLLLVLLLLLLAALWAVSSAINATVAVFNPAPPTVSGSPYDTIAPIRPPSSGSPAIDRITQRGRLFVAVREAPGFAEGSLATGFSGFDIELLELVAQDLGVDPARTAFKPLPAGSLEAALGRKEVDLVLGGYEITPQRRASVGIAGPYLVDPDYGFGLPPDDPVFRERINAVLRTAIHDGTWARLYATHLHGPVPTPPDIE